MSRLDSAMGFLAIVGTVAILAIVGLGENARLSRDSRAWDARNIEIGAQTYDQYCSSCHGPNASGGVCPPLDASSGLHGGDLGPGVAWRLEEIGWDRNQPYEYVYTTTAGGRSLSTRPQRYPGNRLPTAAPAAGSPAPAATAASPMAMPAWSQDFGGPLRADQLDAIASYIVAFRDAIPANVVAARATAQVERVIVGSLAQATAAEPTGTASPAIAAAGTVTATRASSATSGAP